MPDARCPVPGARCPTNFEVRHAASFDLNNNWGTVSHLRSTLPLDLGISGEIPSSGNDSSHNATAGLTFTSRHQKVDLRCEGRWKSKTVLQVGGVAQVSGSARKRSAIFGTTKFGCSQFGCELLLGAAPPNV
jgi:hypothetical protein